MVSDPVGPMKSYAAKHYCNQRKALHAYVAAAMCMGYSYRQGDKVLLIPVRQHDSIIIVTALSKSFCTGSDFSKLTYIPSYGDRVSARLDIATCTGGGYSTLI